MNKLLQFTIWFLLAMAGAFFDAWILSAAYNLLSANFDLLTFPLISYKNWLVVVLFFNVIVSGKGLLKNESKSYDMDDPELYAKLITLFLTKLACLGFFWIITMIL